jgi:hypothetical protein
MTYTIREPWPNPWYNPDQLEIQYFFPLTEQIPLDLDYQPCIQYQENKIPKKIYGIFGTGLTIIDGTTWGTPQLSITPTNSVGTLSVGGLNIGFEEKPNIFRKILFKLLGFKWK